MDAIYCTAQRNNQSVFEVDVKTVLPASCEALDVVLLAPCFNLVTEYTFDVTRMISNQTPLDRICSTLQLCTVKSAVKVDCSIFNAKK
jgi:hypothetical protein